MRSITLKLILSFLIISLIAISLMAFFSRQAVFRRFDTLLFDQAKSVFSARLLEYYQSSGSLEIAAQHIRGSREGLGPAPSEEFIPRENFANRFAVVDPEGSVILPAGPFRSGEIVTGQSFDQGTVLEVDGQEIGRVLNPGLPIERSMEQERFLKQTSTVLLYTAIGAVAASVLLSLLLAYTFTRPLREMTTATQEVAAGKLGQQVPVRSQDEIGQLAQSFNRMSSDLANATRLRKQMTADIAHDLRSPLTVITGYLESMADGVLKPSPERLKLIHAEATHLQRLVEDLRTLSLADAGELSMTRLTQPLQPLLEQTAAIYAQQAGQKQINLQIDIEPDLPAPRVDPDRMMQVLGNLVGNALRHTPAGGRIILSASRAGEGVRVTVRDTGEGISPQDLPHVFDRFYRGDSARYAGEGESGLGLAIARSIVEMHGGRLTAESEPGSGAAFHIDLEVE